MIYNSLHNRWLRLVAAVVGEFISAAALNLFIVPLHLYTGGLMGFCQVLRSVMQTHLGITYDFAGILYFLMNIPILLYAYKNLGRTMVLKTIICTSAYSFFYSVIPVPETPIVSDILTCGGSGGGLDVVGLVLSKRGSRFTVGKFSLSFNAFLYTVCIFLFSPETAIYSVIYNFFTSMVLDRVHQQNVNVQAMIFTKTANGNLASFIMEKLGRGVTYWKGTGAYTGSDLHVLTVCLSKFEIEELIRAVHTIDPNAFVTVQEHVRVYGNFLRKIE